jgi:hypothetical protein
MAFCSSTSSTIRSPSILLPYGAVEPFVRGDRVETETGPTSLFPIRPLTPFTVAYHSDGQRAFAEFAK